ncbi:MAG: spore coat protein CotJB [Oscillospiraceae bacterium]|nr:spore coat protein CotJB [Oscillospiraceae bacterium]
MLERKKKDRSNGEGRLPALAPLAVPFVPFQFNNPQMYEARKGLVRGTLFPGLDLPFMGMVNKNEKPVTPLTELQTMAFAIQELALYLDTHTDDMEALELYRSYQRMYNEAKDKYQSMCGPLNHMHVGEGPYRWLDDPWPWEYAKNKEV